MPTQEELNQLKKDFEELEQLAAKLGKKVDLSNIKNDANAIKELLKAWKNELNELNSEFTNLQDTFKNVVEDLGKANRTSIDVNRSFRTLGGIADKLKYDAEDIADLNKKDLVSLQSKAKIEISSLALQRKRLEEEFKSYSQQELIAAEQQKENKALAKRAAQLLELRSIIEVNGELIKDENNYMAELLKLLDERIKKEDKINHSVGGVAANLIKGLGKIPILGDLLDVEGAQKAMRTAAKNGASSFNQLKLGFNTLGSSLSAALGPLALIMLAVKAVKALVGAMFDVDKQVTALAKNLSISKDEAQGLRGYFIGVSNSIDTTYNRLQDVIDAQIQLSELSKFTILYSKSAIENQIALTKEIGLSEDEASKLNKSFILNNVEGSEGRKIVYDRIAAFANENKLIANGKKVLQDVSKVSGQILLNFRGNLPALVSAVLQADRLGVSLEQSRNISNSLLDFESSISNELEASVFLGRRFNLDRAKALALQKDYVGATEEVLKQVGSIEEFQSMSAIHQQVIAKAANMTVDELSETLMYQQFLTKAQQEQYDRFKKAGQDSLASRLAAGKLVGVELEQAQRSVDAQEKFNLALDKAKEIFTNLVTSGTLDRLANLLKNIGNAISFITGGGAEVEAEYEASKATQLQQNISRLPEGEAKQAELKKLNEQKQILEEITKGTSGLERGIKLTLGHLADGITDIFSPVGLNTTVVEAYTREFEDASKAALRAKKELEELNKASNEQSPQKIQDGISFSDDGPFEITNGYGQTAVTAIGDKLAVSPNISVVDQPVTPTTDFAPMIKTSTPTLDLTPFINAFTSFKNEVITAMNRPQPAPTFVFEGNGTQLGKFVGSQMETGTAQNISTGYTMP
jgi:hypothetical protein